MKMTTVLVLSFLVVALSACNRTPSRPPSMSSSILEDVDTVQDGLACRLQDDGTVVLTNTGHTSFQICLTVPVASHRSVPTNAGDILGFANLTKNGKGHAHFAPLALWQIQYRIVRAGESLTFKGDPLPVTHGEGVDSFRVLYQVTRDTLARSIGSHRLAEQSQAGPIWMGDIKSNIVHLQQEPK